MQPSPVICLIQSSQDPLDQVHTAEFICDGNAEWDRGRAAAVQVAGTCGALHQKILPRAVLPGVVLAVSRDLRIDDGGIYRFDGFVIQSQPFGDIRAEINQHHIRLPQQRQQLLPLGLVLQVHADALFVAVYVVIRRVVAIQLDGGAIVGTIGITGARLFNLDDLGAQIRQAESGKRACKELAEIQDRKAFQRLDHFIFLLTVQILG